MEKEYLNYLKFLSANSNVTVREKLYPIIEYVCLNLKDDCKGAIIKIREFLNLMEKCIGSSKIRKAHLSDTELGLIDEFKNLNENEPFSEDLYSKELKLLEIIYKVCSKFLGRKEYISYFSCLEKYNDIYSKVKSCIRNYKVDPVTSVSDLRTALVNFCHLVEKREHQNIPRGTGENKAAIDMLKKLNMINSSEKEIFDELISNRNSLTYNDANNKKTINKVINENGEIENDLEIHRYVRNLHDALIIFYRLVNRYFTSHYNENFDFPEEYFPIGDAEVLYAEPNRDRQFGQHNCTYYIKKPGGYEGFSQEAIIREYADIELENNLNHNNTGVIITQNLEYEEDKKYFLDEFSIPTANTSYYKYIGYHRNKGYIPLKYAMNLTTKQATEVLIQIANALEVLRKVEPVIYHRNLSTQTILFKFDREGKVNIKIGYFELIKINSEQPTVSDKIKENNFLPKEVMHNADIRNRNYDWSKFDIYSMGIIYLYLLLHREVSIIGSVENYMDNLTELVNSIDVDKDIKDLIISMCNLPLLRCNLDTCIQKLKEINEKI